MDVCITFRWPRQLTSMFFVQFVKRCFSKYSWKYCPQWHKEISITMSYFTNPAYKILYFVCLWESLPYSWDEMQWISTIMMCGLLTQENIAQCKCAPIHTVQGLVLVFDGCRTGRPAIQMFYLTNVTAMQTPIGSVIYVIKRESLSGCLRGCPSRD